MGVIIIRRREKRSREIKKGGNNKDVSRESGTLPCVSKGEVEKSNKRRSPSPGSLTAQI